MKCHLCTGWFEIHTDPQKAEYVIISGARRKVETYEPEDAGVMDLETAEEKEKLALDPMFRIEHDLLDRKRQRTRGRC